MTRAVSVQHIQGQPQTRRCTCDRPVPLAEQEPTPFGPTEQIARCAKCGHRTETRA